MRTVNGPSNFGDVVIEGPELERGIRQAMAREDVPSLAELARKSRIRRDTFYDWFRKPIVRVTAGSVDKLVSVLGAKPGDPWYQELIERTLDPETLALLERHYERLGDRLLEWLEGRFPHNGLPGAS